MPNCDWGRPCDCSDCYKECLVCKGEARRYYCTNFNGHTNYYCQEHWSKELEDKEEEYKQEREKQRLSICCQCENPSTSQNIVWSMTEWYIHQNVGWKSKIIISDSSSNNSFGRNFEQQLQGFCSSCWSQYIEMRKEKEEEDRKWHIEEEKRIKQHWVDAEKRIEERNKQRKIEEEKMKEKLKMIEDKINSLHNSSLELNLVPIKQLDNYKRPNILLQEVLLTLSHLGKTIKRSQLPFIQEGLLHIQQKNKRWVCCGNRIKLFFSLGLDTHYRIPDPRKGQLPSQKLEAI